MNEGAAWFSIGLGLVLVVIGTRFPSFDEGVKYGKCEAACAQKDAKVEDYDPKCVCKKVLE